jgi:hypothetical protein
VGYGEEGRPPLRAAIKYHISRAFTAGSIRKAAGRQRGNGKRKAGRRKVTVKGKGKEGKRKETGERKAGRGKSESRKGKERRKGVPGDSG